MSNAITYEKVETYRVCGVLFTYASSWNGMEEWRDDKGRKLIVMRDRFQGLTDVFGRIFGEAAEPAKLQVVACSPDLVPVLGGNAGLGHPQYAEAAAPGKA